MWEDTWEWTVLAPQGLKMPTGRLSMHTWDVRKLVKTISTDRDVHQREVMVCISSGLEGGNALVRNPVLGWSSQEGLCADWSEEVEDEFCLLEKSTQWYIKKKKKLNHRRMSDEIQFFHSWPSGSLHELPLLSFFLYVYHIGLLYLSPWNDTMSCVMRS